MRGGVVGFSEWDIDGLTTLFDFLRADQKKNTLVCGVKEKKRRTPTRLCDLVVLISMILTDGHYYIFLFFFPFFLFFSVCQIFFFFLSSLLLLLLANRL